MTNEPRRRGKISAKFRPSDLRLSSVSIGLTMIAPESGRSRTQPPGRPRLYDFEILRPDLITEKHVGRSVIAWV